MKRAAVALVVALVIGCGLDASGPGYFRDVSGILVAPPSPAIVGCAIDTPVPEGTLVENGDGGVVIDPGDVLLVWPTGFHARRFATGIEVLDTKGAVVARTGATFRFDGYERDGRWFVSCPQPLPSGA